MVFSRLGPLHIPTFSISFLPPNPNPLHFLMCVCNLIPWDNVYKPPEQFSSGCIMEKWEEGSHAQDVWAKFGGWLRWDRVPE